MKAPKVSVIIPTQNRSIELTRAVHSVLNQTEQDFEILVVDDHSTEDIESLVGEFNDSRIAYLKSHKQPSNANVCRNIGFQNANGEYIAMLDSDDEWYTEHLEKGIRYIEKNNCDGVFGGFVLDDGQVCKHVNSRQIRSDEKMVNYLLADGVAVTPSQIYKTKLALEIMWDEYLLRHQDLDFSVRFADKYVFRSTEDITCKVNWKKNEIRTEHFESQIQFMTKYRSTIDENIYTNYHNRNFHLLKDRNDIPSSVIRYFKSEAVRYIHNVSLNSYIAVVSYNQGKFRRIVDRIVYVMKVAFKI